MIQKLLVKVEVLVLVVTLKKRLLLRQIPAGVSTAFTPTGNATLFMSNKVSVISPNSDANSVVQIQQVQTTGSA